MTQSQSKAYYDDFSDWYERERGRGYHRLIDDLEIEIAEPFAAGRRVLEAGCGTGLILGRLARIATSAWGFDLSGGMVKKAQQRGLKVVLGDVTHIPFKSASFDLVCSFKVLAHVPDIRAALAEVTRVTAPGGSMVLEFYNPKSLRYLAKLAAGPKAISKRRTEADVYTRWDSAEDIEKLLPPGVELLGLRGVRVFTPAAFVYKLPVIAEPLRRLERWAVDSPMCKFGGFLVAVLHKRA
jgi:ubiquinone/menaquinone biosynthesis C-methylase UbiE